MGVKEDDQRNTKWTEIGRRYASATWMSNWANQQAREVGGSSQDWSRGHLGSRERFVTLGSVSRFRFVMSRDASEEQFAAKQ